MIQVSKVDFSYDEGQSVLRGMELTVEEGQWLAVVGANGSGKSTLARLLNGLLLPTAGRVTVDGLDTLDEEQLWQLRQLVAFVFQNPDNQLVATSVEDDVAFGPENLGLPREDIVRRVEEALQVVGLTEQREQQPHLLSGGEKQRVALAGAIAMASKYLVLDEPTSMLDPGLRRSVIACLRRLHQQRGLTIVYVTNIMEEVLLAQRVIVIADGAVARDVTPAELFSDPEWLREQRLDVPQTCRLAAFLADNGLSQLRGVTDPERLVELLC